MAASLRAEQRVLVLQPPTAAARVQLFLAPGELLAAALASPLASPTLTSPSVASPVA